MDRILEPLRQEYDRWARRLGNGDDFPSPFAVTTDDVLRAHFLLCDYFVREGEDIAIAGPRNETLLGSAISRQSVGFNGQLKWNTPHQVTATLFYGLVKNHPFHDGNKRTALLVALYQITKNGRVPDAQQKDFETLVVRTAANELNAYSAFAKFEKKFSNEADARVHFVADFFRRKTRKSDSRFYAVTYDELRGILEKFGYELVNPSGNFIDLARVEFVKTGWLSRKTKKVYKKILQIGYPGGNREVGKGAISSIRRATGLTADNGVDSRVFFKDADPLSVLIARYHGPLSRLKDK